MAHMDTDEILQLIIEVAAEIIVPRFKALGDDQIEQKSPGDFVTVADREAEVRITERLLARQPGALVVGEEARPMAAGAKDSAGLTVRTVADADAAEEILRAELRAEDVVLFKSSRDAGLRWLGDRIVEREARA